ncbi:MAG: hypothetical protein NZ730_10575 [Porticoccaceae bacterium]|nr:hypothetical protein [Porticoccaceae bacterium]
MTDKPSYIGDLRGYKKIKAFLQRENFDGFTADDLFIIQFFKKGWGQDIAALSNMAEALRNMAQLEIIDPAEIKQLLNSAVLRALHKKVSPYKRDPRDVKNLGRYGYYLEHLNIILGCYQAVVDDRYLVLNQRVTQHLVDASMAQSNLHAPLLPNVRMRWSADQAAIIYSVWLFDQNNDTSLSNELSKKWIEYMDANMCDPRTGLYATEVMGVKRYSKQPRGCALAYLIYYSSHFAPQVASAQWALFKEHMLIKRMGITGFREYLTSYKGGWTPDSGPIIGGIGVGASGLALKTAASMNDEQVYKALHRSVSPVITFMKSLVHVPLINRLARLGADLLATSIKLNSESQITLTKRSSL